jgi:hypothetical protein
MTEKMIYLVTSGCYSDYGVESVWTTREAADAQCVGRDDSNGYGSRVEEFYLDAPSNPEAVWWEANYRDGAITVADKAQTFDSPPPEPIVWGRPGTPYQARAYGRSPEHARKILSDHIAASRESV